MEQLYKKINNVLEYFFIAIILFTGIRKGGYYKDDSLFCVFITMLVSLLYFILNYKDLKVNKVVTTSLLIFSGAYFIPIIIQNVATVSGALNIATRIYSMFLIYVIISNSENKKKYLTAFVIFIAVVNLFALDEMCIRIFEKPLNFLGGGYLEDNNGRIGSVFEYSNLLAIANLISILYLLIELFNNLELSNVKKVIYKLAIWLFTTLMILTQSKMVILLYIISILTICITNSKSRKIADLTLNLIYAIISSALIEKVGVGIIFVLALVSLGYILIERFEKIKKYKFLFGIIIICVFLIIALKTVMSSGVITSFKSYFDNFYSTKLRFVYYLDALKIIVQTPINFIFGVGGNSFRTMYETVQSVEYISLEAHSFFIQVFLEAGIIGLIAIIIPIGYLLFKTKEKNNKIILFTLIIFMSFDVFLTYTFMLYFLAIILAQFELKQDEITKLDWIINGVVYSFILVIVSAQIIAFFIEPIKLDNLNNSLEKQEKIVRRCEIALKFDPFDINYIENYTLACKTYIEILEIKEEIYDVDNTKKKYEYINKIYNNIQKEIKYEKNNKYAIEDNVYYVYKYVDELVMSNYALNVAEGYEKYLEDMLAEIENLAKYHSYNEYALKVYKSCLNKLYIKYSYVNKILNSQKIQDMLETIQENI